jgi:catechol 2,3-dioxygenase-like lactoylglutathione lyase family enzyme
MINHLSLGVRDLDRTRRVYDAALAPLGYSCLSDADGALGYGGAEPVLWFSQTDHPVPADERSGLHICFDAAKQADVAAFHAAALRTGGTDNGAPGLRPEYGEGYYAAFAVDPDGYRLEAYCGQA